MERSRLRFLISFLLIVAGCGKESGKEISEIQEKINELRKDFSNFILPCSDENGKYIGGEFILIRNLEYSNGLLADLYLPASPDIFSGSDEDGFAVAIHIHGGGWTAGSRRVPMARWWGEVFSCNGIAFLDVEYTLAPSADVTRQVKEIKCSISWTQTEGRKYGIGKKILVLGGSAGGHLTALVSFSKDKFMPSDQECPHIVNQKSIDISGAIPFYGIYEFTKWYLNLIENFKIYPPGAKIDEFAREISPLNYVDNVNFPVLIIHGSADFISLEQPMKLYNELKRKGNSRAEILIIKDAVHAFDTFPQTDYTKQAKEKILDLLTKEGFIKQNNKIRYIPQYDEKKAYHFLKEGFFKHAHAEFSNMQEKKGKSCETEYGKFLALVFSMINDVINSVETNLLDLISNIAPIEIIETSNQAPSTRILPKEGEQKSENPEWNMDSNLYYENYIEPIEGMISEIESSANYILENSCKFYIEEGIPLYSNIFTTEIRIGQKFGDELPTLSLAVINAIRFLLNLIFSHDLKFRFEGETERIFIPYFLSYSGDDLWGVLRSLAIMFQENQNLLKFFEKRKMLFNETKGNLLSSISYFVSFIDRAFTTPEDNSDVLSLKDTDKDGKLSISDRFSVGVVKTSGKTSRINEILNLIELLPLLISQNDIVRIKNTLIEIKGAIQENKFINVSVLNNFIPDSISSLISQQIEDNLFPSTISLNIGGFISASTPFRNFLPEIVYTDVIPKNIRKIESTINQIPSFLIEIEISEKSDPENFVPSPQRCYVCGPGERFSIYDGMLSVSGKTIEKLQDDGISLENIYVVDKSTILGIPYIYFSDPSFQGNILIKDERKQGEFSTPDNFLLNKAIADMTRRLEKIIGILRIQ